MFVHCFLVTRVDSSDMLDTGCMHAKFATTVVPVSLVSDTGIQIYHVYCAYLYI